MQHMARNPGGSGSNGDSSRYNSRTIHAAHTSSIRPQNSPPHPSVSFSPPLSTPHVFIAQGSDSYTYFMCVRRRQRRHKRFVFLPREVAVAVQIQRAELLRQRTVQLHLAVGKKER